MKSFSERKGIIPIKYKPQIDSMDMDLRTGFWNLLTLAYWDRMKGNTYISDDKDIESLINRLWFNYFKKALDSIDHMWFKTHRQLREFFFGCNWNQVYDFIEFVGNSYSDDVTNTEFMQASNRLLEREMSGYRFINGHIAQISDEGEILEIEQAISSPLKSVREHLNRALELMSDRDKPDYRNSIKESISAIESMCKHISGDERADLSKALRKLESKVAMHSALKMAFDKLYGYSNDEKGIRHAIMDESRIEFEDAKFMLISCSAFINYLLVKAMKAGIELA
jgi:hypothetical protein